MAKKSMQETRFLFQPRGEDSAWLFRMATPAILVGRINPRTDRPYGKEVRESLGGHRGNAGKRKAREERDRRLGAIREEERQAIAHARGSMDDALEIAASLRTIEDADERETAESVLVDRAEELEARMAKSLEPKLGRAKALEAAESRAVRWYKAAVGERTPVKAAIDQYKDDRGKSLSKSSLNNLETAAKEFLAFAGQDVSLQEVDRRSVAEFVTSFLPNRKGPKAPAGQGPATIRKKVSQLAQVWRWSQKRGLLSYSKETPWDDQAPSKKEIEARRKKRRLYTPEETRKLLAAAPEGDALGDLFRVALLCGVRLEEVASLTAAQVEPAARWYQIREGKTKNAARIVPLVSIARAVVARRLAKAAANGGLLFPEATFRASQQKRGSNLSQAFSRLRKGVLGNQTNGSLDFHALRHTWRTAARRAGVDERTTRELGGWGLGSATDLPYDHGREIEQYECDQQRVADWFQKNSYLGE